MEHFERPLSRRQLLQYGAGGLAAASLYLPVIAGLPAAAIDIVNAAIALFITARAIPRPRWLRPKAGMASGSSP